MTFKGKCFHCGKEVFALTMNTCDICAVWVCDDCKETHECDPEIKAKTQRKVKKEYNND